MTKDEFLERWAIKFSLDPMVQDLEAVVDRAHAEGVRSALKGVEKACASYPPGEHAHGSPAQCAACTTRTLMNVITAIPRWDGRTPFVPAKVPRRRLDAEEQENLVDMTRPGSED